MVANASAALADTRGLDGVTARSGGKPASMILFRGGASQESGEELSLGMYVELSINGGQVITDGAGTQEHRTGDIGGTLAGYQPSHYLRLAGG
jgi:hypothetical protein